MFVSLFYMRGSFPKIKVFGEVMECSVGKALQTFEFGLVSNRTDGAANGYFSENTKFLKIEAVSFP